jgi:hypothetical protein
MVAATWPGRAVPSLGPFAELLGQPYQRLKVAALRQLAAMPEPSWSLAEAGQALAWLEPATANRLLSELRTDGLVVEAARHGPPDGPPAWRLSDEAHLVATVCAVLAAPAVAPERAVKVLAAAMALARAAGVDERSAFAPFVAATAVLERDQASLRRLIDEGADQALSAAAEVADTHLADMVELARQVARPGGHEPERERAAAVAGRLRALVDEVRRGPAADDPAPPLVAADPAALAALVAGRLRLPPALAPVRAGEALAALEEHLGRPEPVEVPLPEPSLLPIESPEVVPDFVVLAADVMTWLAGRFQEGTDLASWVVGGTWAEATARMAAVVEAWSRWGPAGDGSLAAALDPRPRLDLVGREEIGVMSWTGVHAPAGGPAAEPAPAVIDLTDDEPGQDATDRGAATDRGDATARVASDREGVAS